MTVSVIVPVYNVAAYLRECVMSILRQTHAELEIILVDDGSTDESPAICDEYARSDARVRVARQPNGGVSAARNAGLLASTGDFVLFVDGDDSLRPDAIEQLLAAMRDDLDFVLGKLVLLDGNRQTPERWTATSVPLDGLAAPEQYAALSGTSGLCLWQVFRGLYRRRFLLENGLFFNPALRLAEDLDWMMRVVSAARGLSVAETPFYLYRLGRAGSLSSAPDKGALLGALAVLGRLSGTLPATHGEAFMRATADPMITSLCLLLASARALSKADRRVAFGKAEEARGLFRYARGKKQRLARMLVKTLGIEHTASILYWSRRLRGK